MKAVIDRAADLGVGSVTIGMPHRGRLNILANVVRKPVEQIFHEFTGKKSASHGRFVLGFGGSGRMSADQRPPPLAALAPRPRVPCHLLCRLPARALATVTADPLALNPRKPPTHPCLPRQSRAPRASTPAAAT